MADFRQSAEKIRSFFRGAGQDGGEKTGILSVLSGKAAAAAGGALFIIVCVLIAAVTSMATESCSRSGTTGTWVLREDYLNGFDAADRYVEFRSDGSFFVNGSHKGYLVLDGKKRGISTIPDVNYLSSSADTVRLENNKLIIEAKSNRLYDFPSADAWRLQVYILVSRECGLTPEERSELY